MSVRVVFQNEHDDLAEQECEEFKVRPSGLELLARSDDPYGSNQVGYIPYESLEYVKPAD